MKEYLKMADVFYGEQFKVGGMVIFNDLNQECFKAVASDYAKYAAHAIITHDELVAEVERLRGQLACAFMAGWEEGVNGIECDEAEVASVEIAEQFARN